MKDINISGKLWILIAIMSVGLLSFGAYSYMTLNKVKVNGPLYQKIIQGKDLVADILPPPEYLIESYLTLYQMVESKNGYEIESLITKSKKLEDEYMTRHKYWVNVMDEGEMKKILIEDSYNPALEFFSLMNEQFIPAIKNGNIETANLLLETGLKERYYKHRKAIDEVVTLAGVANGTMEDETREIISARTLLLVAMAFAILILSVFTAKWIIGLITKPVNSLAEAAVKVSHGDLTQCINYSSKDEVGKLSTAFNKMVENIRLANEQLNDEKKSVERKVHEAVKDIEAQREYLALKTNQLLEAMGQFSSGDLTVEMEIEKEDQIGLLFKGFNQSVKKIGLLISELTDAVNATASASNEISSSTEELATGSQEQSSQVAEVATAVEQMTKTIIKTTQNSSLAAKNAKNAGAIAKEGGKVVQETVEGMNRVALVVSKAATTVKELGRGSDQIGEIVQVIDDIADQTNLLALNAAIEAARAGEQGRGFAVVADEVRKLAERTTKATKEIAVMIKRIQKDTSEAVISMDEGTKEVERGREMAAKAGESLSQIISAAQQVVDVINQVASTSEEQSSATEQTSKSIDAISLVIQESTSATQQIANATEDLNRLTMNLQEMIAQFRVDDKIIKNERSNYAVYSNGKLRKQVSM
jgi:methyl-accepting chemotaxis protein